MSGANRNEPAFPWLDVESAVNGGSGMTLRDWFATGVDKDEYGDLIYRNLSRDAMAEMVGEPHPGDPEAKQTREERVTAQIDRMLWEMKVRAAIRYRFADAMLAEREKGGEA